MKKWLSLLLAACMLFSLAACSQEDVDTALDLLDAVTDTLSEEDPGDGSSPQQSLPDSQAPPSGSGTDEEAQQPEGPTLPEDGQYDDKDNVALYIHLYGKLPSNYMAKQEAEAQYGWTGGALDVLAPGRAIGGSRFGNYEGLLPDREGRIWTECDIGTVGGTSRGARRIVFSNDGLIYYTDDHYESFELLYGEE